MRGRRRRSGGKVRGSFAGRRRSVEVERSISSGSVARRLALLIVSVGVAWGATPGHAANAEVNQGPPMVVSPGSRTVSLAADSCPTFSWGGLAGAERYELVIYRLGKEKENLTPVLNESLPGSASSWTPPLDLCLEGAGRYVWSIQASAGGKSLGASPPSFFHVAAGPSAAERERALAAAEQVLAEVELEAEARAAPLPASAAQAQISTRGVESLAPAGTQLTVDGNLDAVSFSGSSSLLTDVRPDPPCFNGTQRFVNCSNGTVTDTKTGLIWLRDLACFGSLQDTFVVSNASAGDLLASGLCGLTDGSHPGDWRLSTLEEWQTILMSGCPNSPKIVGNGSPTPGCFSDGGWALNVPVSGPATVFWAIGDGTNVSDALTVGLSNAALGTLAKSGTASSWPVRSSP